MNSLSGPYFCRFLPLINQFKANKLLQCSNCFQTYYPANFVSTNHNNNNKNDTDKDNNPLIKEIIRQIKLTGPLTVGDYMKLSLTHPKYGFYMNQDVFGKKGHFITSPEISQLFGEMIGLWIFYNWQQFSRNTELDIIELGPGRGTMTSDIARVLSHFQQQISNGCQFNLIEISPFFRQLQHENICGTNKLSVNDQSIQSNTIYNQPISWFESLNQYFSFKTIKDKNRFKIFIANEFFDALPIYKFTKNKRNEWRELLIDYDSKENLRFICAQNETPMVKLLNNETYANLVPDDLNHLEFCPQALLIIEQILEQIVQTGNGCLLICDYGYDYDKKENQMDEVMGNVYDTFRAYKNHQQCDPLKYSGQADLTADVNFGLIKNFVQKNQSKIKCFGPVLQKDFLAEMGITFRLKGLLEANENNPSIQKELISGFKMLVEDMGTKFKFMAFFEQHLLDSQSNEKTADDNRNQPSPTKPVGFLM